MKTNYTIETAHSSTNPYAYWSGYLSAALRGLVHGTATIADVAKDIENYDEWRRQHSAKTAPADDRCDNIGKCPHGMNWAHRNGCTPLPPLTETVKDIKALIKQL